MDSKVEFKMYRLQILLNGSLDPFANLSFGADQARPAGSSWLHAAAGSARWNFHREKSAWEIFAHETLSINEVDAKKAFQYTMQNFWYVIS